MEQGKPWFNNDNNSPPAKKKLSFGVWTLIVAIIIAFGFGYGVGFVSSAYFRNINLNKELSNNIQILQANNTSTQNSEKPKFQPQSQSKVVIQSNNTNSSNSELTNIVNSLANKTNATSTVSQKQIAKIQKIQESINKQVKPKVQESKVLPNKESKNKVSYSVQVASFPDRSKALNLVVSLIQKGYNATSEQIIINNTPFTRVIINTHTLSDANKIAAKLKQDGITNLPIIYERKTQ